MAKKSRSTRLAEACAPLIVPGIAMSMASAIWLPIANLASGDTRMRSSARASAQIRSAVSVRGPSPAIPRRDRVPETPDAVLRECRLGDAPEGERCEFHVIDMP